MYYALKDTRTPLRYAVPRVILTTVLGYPLAAFSGNRFPLGCRWAYDFRERFLLGPGLRRGAILLKEMAKGS